MLRFFSFVLFVITAFGNGSTAFAAQDIPSEAQPFVENGTVPISAVQADLNGDGLDDLILVLERKKAKETDREIVENQRPLLILLRQTDGSLKVVKRNTKIVYCSTCGGMMGDPFVGIEASPRTFTVAHYGGSAWRWSVNYKFNYSRKDGSWQLVRVEENSFHASEPERSKAKTYTPPKSFGKIDIADFDPQNWKDRGSR
jgi:hypothetical protein